MSAELLNDLSRLSLLIAGGLILWGIATRRLRLRSRKEERLDPRDEAIAEYLANRLKENLEQIRQDPGYQPGPLERRREPERPE